jgi:hypothetical protein
MTFPKMRVLALVGCAALVPAISAPAQVAVQFHFGEDDYHRIDSRHPLKGRQYQTMAALAHTLDDIAQDLNRQAYRSSRGDRTQMRLLASVSDFARRTSAFHNRMDGYLDAPWDLRNEVDDVARRARDVNQRIVAARVFPATRDEWASAIDVLGRMQQVIRGADVELPASPVRHGEGRGEWDHRDSDRNGNGVPDRLEGGPLAAPSADRRFDRERGNAQAAGAYEMRQLGKELDERVSRTRDSMPRTDRDPRTPESYDRFTADTHRLRLRLDVEPYDGRGLKETVTHLLDDARRSSNEARRERSFPGDQKDWERIVDILNQMQNQL